MHNYVHSQDGMRMSEIIKKYSLEISLEIHLTVDKILQIVIIC